MNQKPTNEYNWAGNLAYSAARMHHPETIEQLQEIVHGSRKVRVLGSRHSFNSIANTPEDLICLDKFAQQVTVDRARSTVTVNAGITYGQLCLQLHGAGFALKNMASLPHISVAGACATATHGSGDGNGNLATSVAALELVTASGDVVVLDREKHAEQFQGAVVGLGGLGVVTELTLDVVPAFTMQQDVYENLTQAEMEAHFDEIAANAYSVSLFTDWQNERVNEVWLKRRLLEGTAMPLAPTFYGATLAHTHMHPVPRLSAKTCTLQMGMPGPWHERLPHFRIDEVPSSGAELQTEYFVPREHAVAAIHAMAQLHAHMIPPLITAEIRTIAADALWMSPCYQQDCVAFHFSWDKNWPAVRNLLVMIEKQLAPFDVRPHWGKLFTMPAAQVQSRYKKLADFQDLLRTYDSQGKFRNTFLDTYIFGLPGAVDSL